MKISGLKSLVFRTAIQVIIVVLFLSCGPEAVRESGVSTAEQPPAETPLAGGDTSPGVEVDLSVPPPGSQATQEKWDSFDEEKRRSAWDTYLAGQETAGEGETTSAAAQAPPPEGKSVSVVAASLVMEPMEIYYYGLGEVEAGRKYRVSPAVNGTAARVHVSEGDFVEPGDLLFALDSSEWVKDIERTEEKWDTEVTLARIRLDEAEKNLQSTRAFYDRDLVTLQELDKAVQAVAETRLNLEKIQLSRTTELETLQENYRSRLGVSPGRGYVSALSFDEGEPVNSGDYVEIVNLEEVELAVDVPENIVPRIERGAPVLAKAASSPRYGLKGEVLGHSILPDENRSYLVRAGLDNPNQRLLPGMLMEVQIRVSQIQPRFVVPRRAVVTDGTDHFLFFAQDGRAKKVPVELGSGRQGLVQVNGDMTGGDLLIIEGQSYLKAGSSVSVREIREYLPDRIEM